MLFTFFIPFLCKYKVEFLEANWLVMAEQIKYRSRKENQLYPIKPDIRFFKTGNNPTRFIIFVLKAIPVFIKIESVC